MTRDEFRDLMLRLRAELANVEKAQPTHGSTSIVMNDEMMASACAIALARQQENWQAGRRSTRGLKDDGNWPLQLGIHIQGALGEVAFAAMHRAEASVGTIGAHADVGRVEVKAIMDRNHSMIIRRGTPQDTPCALVFLDPPRAELLGWCIAGDLMQEQYLRDVGRGPQYFVPRHALREGAVPSQMIWGRA
jgi:hypothetical protein